MLKLELMENMKSPKRKPKGEKNIMLLLDEGSMSLPVHQSKPHKKAKIWRTQEPSERTRKGSKQERNSKFEGLSFSLLNEDQRSKFQSFFLILATRKLRTKETKNK